MVKKKKQKSLLNFHIAGERNDTDMVQFLETQISVKNIKKETYLVQPVMITFL